MKIDNLDLKRSFKRVSWGVAYVSLYLGATLGAFSYLTDTSPGKLLRERAGRILQSDVLPFNELRSQMVQLINQENDRAREVRASLARYSPFGGNEGYQFEDCDLSALMTSSLEEYRAQAGHSDLELVWNFPQQPLNVRVDRVAIAQVLYAMFDMPGDKKRVEVQLDKKERAVLISVEERKPRTSRPRPAEETMVTPAPRLEIASAAHLKTPDLSIVEDILLAHGGSFEYHATDDVTRMILKIPLVAMV